MTTTTDTHADLTFQEISDLVDHVGELAAVAAADDRERFERLACELRWLAGQRAAFLIEDGR